MNVRPFSCLSYFSNRRVRFMLDALSATSRPGKIAEWEASLRDSNSKNSLPTQVELAICWAAAQSYNIEVAPHWWGASEPDLLIESLVSGRDAIIDVTCTGDVNKEHQTLNAVAVKILDVIRRQNAKRAKGTFITFLPDRGYRNGAYQNKLRIPTGDLSREAVNNLEAWGAGEGVSVIVSVSDLYVRLDFYQRGIDGNQFRSALLSGWERPDRNAVYRALGDKRAQLRNENFSGIRGVILVDVGSKSISRGELRTWEPLYEYEDAINRFFADKPDGLDFVVTLTAGEYPKSSTIFSSYLHTELRWNARVFSRVEDRELCQALEKIICVLPAPRVSSYRLGEMLRAGSKYHASSESISRLKTVFESGYMKPMTIKVSARLVLQFLSGRIGEAEFRAEAGDFSAVLVPLISSGAAIADARLESGGMDQDDDYICLTLNVATGMQPKGKTANNTE